jgi:teichuronic acid biosynthesis glycosyltransferase TuaH
MDGWPAERTAVAPPANTNRLKTANPAQIGQIASKIIVIYAGTGWDGPPSSEKQLAAALSRLVPVLYVDPGLSIVSGLRAGRGLPSRGSQLTVVQPNLIRLQTFVPPGVSRPGLRRIAAAMTTRAVNRWLRTANAASQSVIVFARLTPVSSRHIHGRRVLYGTDDFVAGAPLMGLSRRWVQKLEHKHLTSADLVLAVTPELAT